MTYPALASLLDRKASLMSMNHDLNNQFTILRINIQLALREPGISEETRLMLEDAMCAANNILLKVATRPKVYTTQHTPRHPLHHSS